MIFKSKFKIFCTSSNKKHCDENNIFSDTDIVTHNKSVKRLFGNCEPFDNVYTLNNSLKSQKNSGNSRISQNIQCIPRHF